MKLFLVFSICFYLIPFFIISFIPYNDPLFFKISYSLVSISIIYIFVRKLNFRRYYTIYFDKIKNNSIFILLIIVLFYFNFLRWKLQVHGMVDAYVLWSGKASIITNLYLQKTNFLWSNLDWKFPSYPIALPLTLSGFSIIEGKYNYLFSNIYVNLTLLIFIYIIIMHSVKSKGVIFKIVFSSLIFFMFLDENYKYITSDLCADYPVSLYIGISCILFLKNNSKNNLIYLGLSLALASSMKNEGVIITIVFLIIIYVYSTIYKFIDIKYIIISYFIFYLPTILFKMNYSFVPNDFQNNEGLLSKILNKKPDTLINEIAYVFKFFIQYQVEFQKGILPLLSYFLIVYGSNKQKMLTVFYWMLVLIYSSLFLFSSLDLKEHLDSAYHRINAQIYPILFISLTYNIKILQEPISEMVDISKRSFYFLKNKL